MTPQPRIETPSATESRSEAPARTKATSERGGFFALELLDNRYPALHGLRVIAILSVIQYHVTWVIGTYPQIELDRTARDFSLSIFFGMDCFFVLSGFLIGSILIRSLDLTGTQQIQRFYIRRIFRTFPSYWVVLTIYVLLFPITDAQRAHLIYEYTYLTNFVSLRPDKIVMFWGWSLSLEEQFYLAVPLLFVVLQRLPTDRARAIFLGLLALSAIGTRTGVYLWQRPWTDNELYDALYFRTPTRFDTIVAGILLALVEARWGKQVAAFLESVRHRAMLGIAGLGCAWLLLRPDLFGDEYEQIVHLFTWGTVTSIMYLVLVPMLIHGDGALVRFLSAPLFRRLATVGYGVYLVHIPLISRLAMPMVLHLVARGMSLAVTWAVTFTLVTLLSFVLGYLLHVFVEKPSLRVREWLAA